MVPQRLGVVIGHIALDLHALVQPVLQSRGNIALTGFAQCLLLHNRAQGHKLVQRVAPLLAIGFHLIGNPLVKGL